MILCADSSFVSPRFFFFDFVEGKSGMGMAANEHE